MWIETIEVKKYVGFQFIRKVGSENNGPITYLVFFPRRGAYVLNIFG